MSSMSTPRRLSAIFGIVGILAVGGCAMNDTSPSTGDSHSVTASPAKEDQAKLLTYPLAEGDGSPEAAFEGRLVIEPSDQYLYGEAADGNRIGIVFPEGTTLSQDGSEVVLPDGTRINVGTTVSLTGGYSEDSGTPAPEKPFDEYFHVSD